MSVAKTNQQENRKKLAWMAPWRTPALSHSVVVHGLHKSATMFLFEFFKKVAEDRKLPFYSENLPEAGLPPDDGTAFCFSPVRSFDFACLESNETVSGSTKAKGPRSRVRRIFQVRDPRDILVSEYFSLGWIHPEGQTLSKRRSEIQQMTVDEYVLQTLEASRWPLHEKYDPLLKLNAEHPDFTVVRYEDMVLDFPNWVASTIAPFEFRNPKRAASRYVKQFAKQFDVKTESLTHRRKVTPGDHKEKLRPETISALNKRFKDVLERFGY